MRILLLAALAATPALSQAEILEVKGFYVGMSFGQCAHLIERYSWSGVDKRAHKKRGLRAFTIEGAEIPDPPSCAQTTTSHGRVGVVTFVIPESAMGTVSRAVLGTYPNSAHDCGFFNSDNGRRAYQCFVDLNGTQLALAEVEVKPAGTNEYHYEYQLTLTSQEDVERFTVGRRTEAYRP